MKHLFSFMTLTMVIVFTACQKESEQGTGDAPGQKSISVAVKADEAITRGAATESEKAIELLTVVAYDKDGNNLGVKTLAKGTTNTTFNAIDETKFPIKVFAIANTGGTWTASITDWSAAYSNLATLTLLQKTSAGKALVKGLSPLIMHGESTIALSDSKSVTVILKRPMARISFSNNSLFKVTEISFTGLTQSVGKNNVSTGAKDYTYSESNLDFNAGGGVTKDFYFMPGSTPTITVKSQGGADKTITVTNALVANKVLPVSIANGSIDLGVNINVDPNWDEEGGITIGK